MHQKIWIQILDDFLDFFEAKLEGKLEGKLEASFRASLRQSLRHALSGMPLRGALGRAPPPFGRVEILKKFTGKSVPENYTSFFGKIQLSC